jgi:DNA-binding MarR family transcriptional regulator
MLASEVEAVLRDYPRIYFACHRRHVPDPKTRRVLSRHQASILDHLDERAATSVSELARHMGVTVSTMSLAVERLVKQGYVRRTRDQRDRRRAMVRLSAAGTRIKDSQSVLDPESVRAMLRRLSEAERNAALRGLALLARAASAQIEGHGAAGRTATRRTPH